MDVDTHKYRNVYRHICVYVHIDTDKNLVQPRQIISFNSMGLLETFIITIACYLLINENFLNALFTHMCRLTISQCCFSLLKILQVTLHLMSLCPVGTGQIWPGLI